MDTNLLTKSIPLRDNSHQNVSAHLKSGRNWSVIRWNQGTDRNSTSNVVWVPSNLSEIYCLITYNRKSSISSTHWNERSNWSIGDLHLPLHVEPFPLYPLLQVQVCIPSVFSHLALRSHECVLSSHSFISKTGENINCSQCLQLSTFSF